MSRIARKKVIKMAWTTPKTDWKSTDRFNISDYNRIKGNLEYLHEFAEELYLPFSTEDMGDNKESYADYFYADEFNLFEDNLKILNQNIFTQNFGIAQKFYDNGPFIQYGELNRIESATLSMYDLLTVQKKNLPRMAFRLGNAKGGKISN